MRPMQRWQTSSRYYLAAVQQDLFGHWEVYRAWGARGTGHGGVLREVVASEAEAHQRLMQLGRQRLKRGYQPYPNA